MAQDQQLEFTWRKCPANIQLDKDTAILPAELHWNLNKATLVNTHLSLNLSITVNIIPELVTQTKEIWLSRQNEFELWSTDKFSVIPYVDPDNDMSVDSNEDCLSDIEDSLSNIEDHLMESQPIPVFPEFSFNANRLEEIIEQNRPIEIVNSTPLNVNRNLPDYLQFKSVPLRPLNPIFARNSTNLVALKLKKLPTYKYLDAIFESVESNQVTILTGDTGCGKTTLVPFAILERAHQTRSPTLILVSEPKRIAAIKASETLSIIYGKETIGYHIRNEKNVNTNANAIFVTSGVLMLFLETILKNDIRPVLTHFIIDEAHEGNIDTDICIALLTKILQKHRNLKVIIMSATMQTSIFKEYFEKKNHLSTNTVVVPGKAQTLTISFSNEEIEQENDLPENEQENELPENEQETDEEDEIDYRDKVDYRQINNYLYSFIQKFPNIQEAVICFLPGMNEIRKCKANIENDDRFKSHSFDFRLIHSDLLSPDAITKLSYPCENNRVIYLSTNVAETSVTLSELKGVIDAGFEKVVTYDTSKDAYTICTTQISQSSAIQRGGRAGRTKPGFVYRTYTKSTFECMNSHSIPEIQKADIAIKCLKVINLAIEDPVKFLKDLLHPASEGDIDAAIDKLLQLELITKCNQLNRYISTSLGQMVISLPLEIHESIAIIYALAFKCLSPVLNTIAAAHDKGIFEKTGKAKDEIKIANSKLIASMVNSQVGKGNSDHLALGRLFEHCSQTLNSEVYLTLQVNYNRLKTNKKFKSALNLLLHELFPNSMRFNFDANINDPNLIRYCLAAGHMKKIAAKTTLGHWIDAKTGYEIRLNENSTLNLDGGHFFYCFDHKKQSTSTSDPRFIASNSTILPPVVIALFNEWDVLNLDDQMKNSFQAAKESVSKFIIRSITGQNQNNERSFITSLQELFRENLIQMEPVLEIYEVSIAIQKIVGVNTKGIDLNLKDIIRKKFEDYQLIRVYVQQRWPFNGYIILPSLYDFHELFENHNNKPISPDFNSDCILGYAFPKTTCFINKSEPTNLPADKYLYDFYETIKLPN